MQPACLLWDEKVKKKTTQNSYILGSPPGSGISKARKGRLSLGAMGVGGARTAEEGCSGGNPGRVDPRKTFLCMS